MVGDFTGDGVVDIYSFSGANVYAKTAQSIRSVPVSISNGLSSYNIKYATLPSMLNSSYIANLAVSYPRLKVVSPIWVVDSVSTPLGAGGERSSKYSYGNLLAEVGVSGRGMLGFQWMQTDDVNTGLKSRTWYRQDFPYVGMVDKSTQGFGGSVDNLSQTTYEYGCYDFDQTVGCQVAPSKRYFVYQTKMLETAKDLAGKALPGKRTETVYDCASAPVKCFGNATKVTITTLNPDGTASGYSKVTDSEYFNDETNWRLGKVLRSKVTSVTP
jgi:hypothetical protein